MDAGKKTISDILNGNRIIRIPFFQRSYVWSEPQWERFIDDMEGVTTSNRLYFIGSCILKQAMSPSSSGIGDIREVIDGQQRLTTIAVFFKVLCLKSNNPALFERNFLLLNGSPAIEHNYNDIESFDSVMKKTNLTRVSNPRTKIDELFNYCVDNIVESRFDVQRILNNVTFIGIDLSLDDDEQRIFDTINSLGVRLTTPELLKNFFFNKNEIELFETHWKQLYEKDDEQKKYWDTIVASGSTRRSYLELLFFCVLQILIQDDKYGVSASDKIDFSRVEDLFSSFKKFIKDYLNGNKIAMLEILKKYQECFSFIFTCDWFEKHVEKNDFYAAINNIIFGLDTATIMPYVLYVTKCFFDDCEVSNLNEILRVLVSYIMRRMATRSNTKNYNNFFNGRLINNQINTHDKLRDFILSQTEATTYSPSDKDLSNGFHNSKLINKQALGIIYLLESQTRNPEQSTVLKPMNQYQLEHLMPKKWQEYWAEPLFTPDQIANRAIKLLTLGNLAIITEPLNKSLSNKSWQEKVHSSTDKRCLDQLSSGVETLQKYLVLEVWDEKTIEERANDLCKRAISAWKI